MTRVIAYIDTYKGELLTSLPGETIDEATDEYQIRLKDQKGSVLNFHTIHPDYESKTATFSADTRRLTAKATILLDDMPIRMIGKCIRI